MHPSPTEIISSAHNRGLSPGLWVARGSLVTVRTRVPDTSVDQWEARIVREGPIKGRNIPLDRARGKLKTMRVVRPGFWHLDTDSSHLMCDLGPGSGYIESRDSYVKPCALENRYLEKHLDVIVTASSDGSLPLTNYRGCDSEPAASVRPPGTCLKSSYPLSVTVPDV